MKTKFLFDVPHFGKGNPVIRIYTDIDSRYILEDFFAKLQINFGSDNKGAE